jgi:hypothetical protein
MRAKSGYELKLKSSQTIYTLHSVWLEILTECSELLLTDTFNH